MKTVIETIAEGLPTVLLAGIAAVTVMQSASYQWIRLDKRRQKAFTKWMKKHKKELKEKTKEQVKLNANKSDIPI